jgi:hypothetical protein
MLPDVPEENQRRTSTTCMDAVIHYIERHTPVKIELDGRWVRDDEAEVSDALAAAMEGMEPLVSPLEKSSGPYQ